MEKAKNNSQKEKFDSFYALSLVGQVGYAVAIPLLIFTGGGVLLDKQFGTKPTYTLVGLIVGMVVSFFSLYQLLKPFLTKKGK